MTPALNKALPELEAQATGGVKFTHQAFKGQAIVLYFYPKDNTPGCTTEAREFSALKPEFAALNCEILGMSPDSVKAHQNFTAKQDLSVNLASDPDHGVLEQFGAWRLKKNYGKEYMGVARSTVLIDPQGVIRHVWPTVKAAGHAAEVLDTLRKLR